MRTCGVPEVTQGWRWSLWFNDSQYRGYAQSVVAGDSPVQAWCGF